ncbi:V-type proton ATPase subunit e [Lachnellula willkommii]|uniref:V-type proton ATPase subunit e n=1 Tax=Lachnellula willkommii TaxID=215461 RepID=A0A559M6K5_9HELO|nr:V-type proton ATPase subunit e [Lachnellula willkommii]
MANGPSANISSHSSWSIIIGLVVIVLACAAGWFLAPKGETQTIWRSSLILSFASCYIMWAITFLAQWHPLIVPRRSGLRTGAAHEN